MHKKFQKALQEFLSKIKKQTPHIHLSHRTLSSTTSKILAGCKNPRSRSFTKEHKSSHKNNHLDSRHLNTEASATLEDIDKFLIENFRSLYGEDNNLEDQNDMLKNKGKTKVYNQRGTNDDINLKGVGILFDNSPNFFTPSSHLHASHRFFVSPSSSGSLIEEVKSSAMGTTSGYTSASTGDTGDSVRDDKSNIPQGVEDCIALLTVSPNLHEDFKRSMQEILDARINNNQSVNWEFLEELLFCYMRLNDKKQYRYILSAFVDSIVGLRQNSAH